MSATALLANYAVFFGTAFAVLSFCDLLMSDRQKSWFAGAALYLRGALTRIHTTAFRAAAEDNFQRPLIAILTLGELALVFIVARRVDYAGPRGAPSLADVAVANAVLFLPALLVGTTMLVNAGPRLVAWFVRARNIYTFTARCFCAALVSDTLFAGAVWMMNRTFAAFGPRADLDWADPRFLAYAAEYALSAIPLSIAAIAHPLTIAAACASLAVLFATAVLAQIDFLVGKVVRYPRGALLGGSICAATLAAMFKDWV